MSEIVSITTALFITVLSTILSKKWKEINNWYRSLMVLSILGAFFLFFNQLNAWMKARLIEKIEAKFGDFKDLEGATIPRLCSGKCVGNGWPVNKDGLFVVNNTGPLFRVYVKDGELFIDVVIRDKSLNVVAAIDGNEWTIFNDDYEYNNDETGFEIVTKGDRKVYFQIYLEGGIAHVLGIITNKEGIGFKFLQQEPDGETRLLDKDHDYESFSLVAILPTTDEYKLNKAYEAVSDPIFKYPRGKYLGVRK